MKLSIRNATDHYQDKNVYFALIGQQNDKWGFLNEQCIFQEGGCETQNIPFLNLAETPDIPLPQPLISGRVWISICEPLQVPLSRELFVGPGFNAPSDPNYNIVFDKFELTYRDDDVIFCNTTSVDYFGLALTAELVSDDTQTVGYSSSRDDIFAAFETDSLFKDLVISDKRVLAPQKKSEFPPDYLDSYINECWALYKAQPLEMPIIVGQDFIAIGQVDDKDRFNFEVDGNVYTVKKPTTANVFGCDGVFNLDSALCEPRQAVDGTIKRQVAAALNRGILQNSDASTWPDSNTYYQIPAMNVYSKLLHDHSQKIDGDSKCYGFPYDDVYDHSTLLVSKEAAKSLTLTITA